LFGWICENKNNCLQISWDRVIDLNDKNNVSQFQHFINLVLLIKPYLKQPYRFDIMACNLDNYMNFNEICKFVSKITEVNIALSANQTGNENKSDWILEHGNVNLLVSYFKPETNLILKEAGIIIKLDFLGFIADLICAILDPFLSIITAIFKPLATALDTVLAPFTNGKSIYQLVQGALDIISLLPGPIGFAAGILDAVVGIAIYRDALASGTATELGKLDMILSCVGALVSCVPGARAGLKMLAMETKIVAKTASASTKLVTKTKNIVNTAGQVITRATKAYDIDSSQMKAIVGAMGTFRGHIVKGYKFMDNIMKIKRYGDYPFKALDLYCQVYTYDSIFSNITAGQIPLSRQAIIDTISSMFNNLNQDLNAIGGGDIQSIKDRLEPLAKTFFGTAKVDNNSIQYNNTISYLLSYTPNDINSAVINDDQIKIDLNNQLLQKYRLTSSNPNATDAVLYDDINFIEDEIKTFNTFSAITINPFTAITVKDKNNMLLYQKYNSSTTTTLVVNKNDMVLNGYQGPFNICATVYDESVYNTKEPGAVQILDSNNNIVVCNIGTTSNNNIDILNNSLAIGRRGCQKIYISMLKKLIISKYTNVTLLINSPETFLNNDKPNNVIHAWCNSSANEMTIDNNTINRLLQIKQIFLGSQNYVYVCTSEYYPNNRCGIYVRLMYDDFNNHIINIAEMMVRRRNNNGTDKLYSQRILNPINIFSNTQYYVGQNFCNDKNYTTILHTDVGSSGTGTILPFIEYTISSNYSYNIDNVQIVNRFDACQDRLLGSKIAIFDQYRYLVWMSSPVTLVVNEIDYPLLGGLRFDCVEILTNYLGTDQFIPYVEVEDAFGVKQGVLTSNCKFEYSTTVGALAKLTNPFLNVSDTQIVNSGNAYLQIPTYLGIKPMMRYIRFFSKYNLQYPSPYASTVMGNPVVNLYGLDLSTPSLNNSIQNYPKTKMATIVPTRTNNTGLVNWLGTNAYTIDLWNLTN